ncbi:hypothetical protein IFM89_013248 [Coptis chinensis]|uniref:F-box domain-containing protein n=1 Tax=Coptis chinensis TaxID=261450 RepID=A0A835ITA1_9MAGN|nr:hypothetical protein IFM89_013248 [Coptis chinensis]
MPPKKNRRRPKKKNLTIANLNPSTSTSTSRNNVPNPTNINNFAFQPNFFQGPFMDGSDDDLPFDPYECYDYDTYDDYSNPFDPSYHSFVIEGDNVEKKSSFAFEMVEDLDAYVKEGGKKRCQALFQFPLDIFLDIISRLPIKPLAVCRCVCKTWRTIVHHPRFVKMHHHKVTQVQRQPHALNDTSLLIHVSAYLLCELNDISNFSEIVILEPEKDDNIEKGNLVNPPFMPPKLDLKCSDLKYDVVGSCNGLVCLASPVFCDPAYVCNPVIGEYITLPLSNKGMGYQIASGIGFDQSANEYKVVRTIFDFMCNRGLEAEVYTIGSGKWRKLGKIPYPCPRRATQVFVEGALHWMASEYDESELIIAFDVGKEEFQIIQLPPDYNPDSESCEECELQLGELGGNLCLFSHLSDDRCEVWVMKEYGVRDSWTKEYVISRKVSGFSDVFFKPVKLMKNGNILLVVNRKAMVYYEPTRKRFRKLKISHIPPQFDVITHVGTFISLRGIVEPATSKNCVNSGRWYGTMKSVTSRNPEFDIEGWKLNEQLRRLWFEEH